VPKVYNTCLKNCLHFLAPNSGMCVVQIFWYQIPVLIRKLFYSKPQSCMHVTEMMTCDWSMITVFTCCEVVACSVAICLYFYLIFSATFIFGARKFHSRCTWNIKLVPKTGTGKWSRLMVPVSGARFMGQKKEGQQFTIDNKQYN